MDGLVAAADLVAFQVDEHVGEAGRHADEQQGRPAQHGQPRRLQPGRPAQRQQTRGRRRGSAASRPRRRALPHLEPPAHHGPHRPRRRGARPNATTPSLMRTTATTAATARQTRTSAEESSLSQRRYDGRPPMRGGSHPEGFRPARSGGLDPSKPGAKSGRPTRGAIRPPAPEVGHGQNQGERREIGRACRMRPPRQSQAHSSRNIKATYAVQRVGHAHLRQTPARAAAQRSSTNGIKSSGGIVKLVPRAFVASISGNQSAKRLRSINSP